MKKEITESLESSIKRWVKIRDRVIEFDHGICSICDECGYNCNVCPIKAKTGALHCNNTPYYKVRDIAIEGIQGDTFKTLCQEMIDILKSCRSEK